MKKIIILGLGAVVLSCCLGGQNAFLAKAYIAAADGAASVVVGQQDMSSNSVNQNTSVGAINLNSPCRAIISGTKLIVADTSNHRVLIYNTIPVSNNASADVVVGQTDMTGSSANQGGAVGANTLRYPVDVYTDGTKLIISDYDNSRVLIYNTIPVSNNASADVVVGQEDMTHRSANQGGAASASTLNKPYGIYYNGAKLFIADKENNRVLIYNSIPTSNNASANVVVGQANMTSIEANQGAGVSESTLNEPIGVWADNDKLIVGDFENNRVLIYNSIPVSNNASANVVVGQANMTSSAANQGTSATAATLNKPHGVFVYNSKLYLGDYENNRVLAYNATPTSNNTSADTVVGQADMNSVAANRGGSAASNTLNKPYSVFADSSKLVIADRENNRILLYDNQDVTATPATITYSNKKSKSKTVTLNFYGLSVSKTKKKYYTVKIGGKNMKVKSVKKYSDRVKVRVKYKYGKKARGTYGVYLKYKYKSTINTRTADNLITIQ